MIVDDTVKEKPKRSFNLSFKDKKWLTLSLGLIIAIPLIGYAASGFINRDTSITSVILSTIGSDLQKDRDGYTNILALGVGGEGHEGEELTDTILVGSLHEKTGQVVMTSIPRDLYVQHDNIISQRINSVYENVKYSQDNETAYQTISEVAEQITGREIHYHIKIDFEGVVKIVDALGGITIDVPETLYDPYYPGPNFTYQTFALGKGIQDMDGETALKYVRSRKTTSDFDRSLRQQQLLFAIKEKALEGKILKNKDKIIELLNGIEENVEYNFDLREIISLAAVAVDFSTDKMNRLVLHNDPIFKGGFLYTPPRSQYQDAFVLLPAGNNYNLIHDYVNLHLKYPEFMQDEPPLEILNGTSESGFARNTSLIMYRYGFNVEEIGNADHKDYVTTTIASSEGAKSDPVKALQHIFDDAEGQEKEILEADLESFPVTITLGSDFFERFNELEVYSELIHIIQQAEEERLRARGELEEDDEEDTETAPQL